MFDHSFPAMNALPNGAVPEAPAALPPFIFCAAPRH
jgi:hypothetical protein